MSSYYFSNSHYKDNMISCPPYVNSGNPYVWNDRLNIQMGLRIGQILYYVCYVIDNKSASVLDNGLKWTWDKPLSLT